MNWIPWQGKECPVPKGTVVQVKFRSGHIPPVRPAEHYCWKQQGFHGVIAEYRVSNG